MDELNIIKVQHTTENIRDLIRLYGDLDDMLKNDIFNELDKIDELIEKLK